MVDKTMKIRKFMFYSFGSTYLFAVICILFVRNHRWWPNLTWIEFFCRTSNFIPFKTIVTYISDMISGEIASDIALRNILGNIALFFPMGIFLSVVLKKFNFKHLYLIALAVLILAEVLQSALRVGFFDTDDIILNYAGFIVGLQFVKVPVIYKLLSRFTGIITEEHE